MDGGGNFRANFGVERDGVSLLAEDGSASEGRRPAVRLSGVRPRAAEEARLVGRADRGREEGGRGQELEDRPVGRHPACRDEEPQLPPVRQRQGARGGLELPRRRAAPPRAAVLAAARPRRQVPDARRRQGALAPADAVQVGAGPQRQGRHRREVPADPHERPPGRVRGRRRRDALQPVARRADAGQLRRDQPEGGGRPRRPPRGVRLGEEPDGARASR